MNMKNKKIQFNVAIVGGTGLVGRETARILKERKFPVNSIKILASEKSIGNEVVFGNKKIVSQKITEESFRGTDIAFFCAGSEVSKKYCEIAVKCGATCIDKSSAYRYDKEIPLVVPEVNKHCIKNNNGIISSPNCVTTPFVKIINVLQKELKIKKINLTSLQAVSGKGKNGVSELAQQSQDLFNLKKTESIVFEKRIAFNIIPFIQNEEEKIESETKKILKGSRFQISVTCVRVPIFNGHSLSINIEFSEKTQLSKIKSLFENDRSFSLSENPTPIETTGKDEILIGRIREHKLFKNNVSLWATYDNLSVGSALNAAKIAEALIEKNY